VLSVDNILNSIYVDSLVYIPFTNDSFSVFQINIRQVLSGRNTGIGCQLSVMCM